MNEQEEFEKITRTLSTLDNIPLHNPLRKASARRAYLEHAARLRAEHRVGSRGRKIGRIPSFLRLTTAGLGALILTMGSLTGVAYAADGAKPGDRLYSVDRKVEVLRLKFAPDTEHTVQLMLLFASERLAESEQLVREGDEKNLVIALDAYSQTISEIGQTVGKAGDQQEALTVLVDETLSAQEEQLQAMRAQVPEESLFSLDHAINASHNAHDAHNGEAGGPPEGTPASDNNGPGEELHPTPDPQDDKPKDDKSKDDKSKDDKSKDGKSNGNGPPDSHGPPDNPGQGGGN